MQARFAFATYLMRVQHRLEAQTGSQDADDDNASDEQMVRTLNSQKKVSFPWYIRSQHIPQYVFLISSHHMAVPVQSSLRDLF